LTSALASPLATSAAVADLILVRMILPSKRPVAPSVVRKDVSKLLDSELSTTAFDELRSELASAGLLTKEKRKAFALTDAGRERALQFLGIDALASRTNWSTVLAKYLFPKAAGLTASAASKLNNGDKLAAFILKRKYGLPAGAGSTVMQVLEAVACKQLGFSEETTLDGLLCAVLSSIMGSERLTKKKLAEQLPLFETGLTAIKADDARRKVVRDWLAGIRTPLRLPESHSAEPFDLIAFAATVRTLAGKSPPQDRFHNNKVFIAALWQATQQEPSFPRLSLPEFKQRLVEANSRNLLHLSRADLVQAMDPRLVADSETEYLNATFHFVLLEGDRP
jgi:uncharacterized protein (DUF2267 family)